MSNTGISGSNVAGNFSATGGNFNYGGEFIVSGGASSSAVYAQATGATTNYAGYFTASGGVNNYAGIFAAGNVGIGIATPAQVLHVVGTERVSTLASGAAGAIVTSNLNGDMGFTNFTGNASQVLLGNNTFGAVPGGLSGGTVNYVTKWTSANTLSSTSMLFDDGTNVGIGTTIPINKLDVYNGSTSGSAGNFQITNAASGTDVLDATTIGTGNSGSFQIINALNSNAAILGQTNGSGAAVSAGNTGTGISGLFQIINPANTLNSVQSTTNGTGFAVYGSNTNAGIGGGAQFQITNAGNTSDALQVSTAGTGNAINALGSVQFSKALKPNGLAGTAGQLLQSAGVGAPPTWVTATGAGGWTITGNAGTTPGTNFIGTTDAKDFVFNTGGNTAAFERMRITSTGNVGIGTTVPAFSLELASGAANALALSYYATPPTIIGRRAQGTLAAPTAATSGAGLLDIGGRGYTGAAFTAADAAQIKFFAGEAWTATANGTYMTFSTTLNGSTTLSEQMRIDNAGNVGIGTTAPVASLEVLTNTSGASIAKFLTTSVANSAVTIGNGTTSMNLGVGATLLNPYIWSANGNLTLGNDIATPTLFLQGMSGGNVGIGTSAPAATLDITQLAASLGGTAKSTTFNTMAGALGSALNNTLPLANIGFTSTNQTSLGFLAKRIAAGTSWTGTSIGLVYDVDNTTNVNGASLWLSPASNVGIGVAAPLATLSVSGGTSQGQNGSGTESIVNITTGAGLSTDNQLEFGVVNGSYAWIQAIEPGTTDLDLILQPSGWRVGIGTTAPDLQLSVNGAADKTGGGTWATFSDRRMKKNINGFSDGLDLIKQINPVTFQYNGLGGYKNDGQRYVGVIAQDMQKIAPYMIDVKSKKLNPTDTVNTDLLMYDGSALPYILVNAMKEQQKMIEDLQKENSFLKQSNSTYHAEVDQLKAEFEELKIKLGAQPAKVSVEK